MRRCALVALAVALAVACDKAPKTEPEPVIPPAVLGAEGILLWELCVGGLNCTFKGEGRNTGTGCGGNVRGVTRLFNSQDQVISSASWALSAPVRPNERFTYGGCCLNPGSQQTSYETSISWDNVPC